MQNCRQASQEFSDETEEKKLKIFRGALILQATNEVSTVMKDEHIGCINSVPLNTSFILSAKSVS